MDETCLQLLKYFSENNQFNFSSENPTLKKKYIDSINYLSTNGYITIKAHSIGFVISELTDYGISFLDNI